MARLSVPITIKRYAGQRLSNPGMGAYVTLDAMIEDDEDFVVRDAGTGEDMTQSVLKQIILECGSHG
jgi:polyhydroxyalkanoate synthesis regulator protein